jgi:hypothetical protein
MVAANKNSPKQTVISERLRPSKKLVTFQSPGLDGTILPVSAAFHSGGGCQGAFMKTLERLRVNPSIPVLQCDRRLLPCDQQPRQNCDLLGKQFAAPVEWVKHCDAFTAGDQDFRGMQAQASHERPDAARFHKMLWRCLQPSKKGGMLQLMETLAGWLQKGSLLIFRGRRSVKARRPVARRERTELGLWHKPRSSQQAQRLQTQRPIRWRAPGPRD